MGLVLQANVAVEADVIAMFKTAMDTFGRVDVSELEREGDREFERRACLEPARQPQAAANTKLPEYPIGSWQGPVKLFWDRREAARTLSVVRGGVFWRVRQVIVNNAGITKDGLVMRMKAEQWQSVIDINLTGVFFCSKEAFKVRVL